jgi:3-polyprenyl-4-hydroxybenzoate decarboxylase
MLGAQASARRSEFDVAGGMMGRGIELTEAEFVSLPIPAHAELVIEGVLHEGDVLPEGPLGEFTGYYGRERSPQPVIEVKAVHHRKSPILTAALMAKYPSCEIGAYYAIMRSARILDDLERIGVPGVIAAYAHPAAASGWGMAIVSLQQQYADIRPGAGADRAMPGRSLRKWYRGGRRRRSDRLERGDVGAVDALPSGGGHRHFEEDLVHGLDPTSSRWSGGPMVRRR